MWKRLGCLQKFAKLFPCFLSRFLKANYKTPPSFMKIFEQTWKTSQNQTKFRHGKFNINHLNLSKSIWYYIFSYETFPFFNQGTLMMCLSSETDISIEIHIICIIYWFWNKFRNVVEPINQSRVSMIIVEKGKDFNPEFYSKFPMVSESEKINFSFKNFFSINFRFHSYLRRRITSVSFYDKSALIWQF